MQISKRKLRAPLNSFILTLFLIISACTSSAREAAGKSFPTGTFIPPVQRTAGITMVFSEDGTYVMSGPQFIPLKGTYVVDKDKISFTQTEGGICDNITGTYTWSYDGESLTFVSIEDQCSIRRVDWQAGPWKKQP